MKRMSKKSTTLAILLALVLVVGFAVSGTLAWLTDKTSAVENTFTTSDVDIELTESENLDFKMVPGATIEKDPVVTVKGGSEKCWLFVKVEESEGFGDFMTYEIALSENGWTAFEAQTGVYYREVAASDGDQNFTVLADNKVMVKDTVTKAMMDALEAEGATLPTLTFTAYACQFAKGAADFTAIEAWDAVNNA